jgi:glycosyltransferase involved in cell wall biosynthesis
VLRLIGAQLEIPGVNIECLPWSQATEAQSIAGIDIGLMPLRDSPWERGKCGYKLIQYMACSKPVVASPVGVNARIVQSGVNGFLARSTAEWVETLSLLAADPNLRVACGKQGRSMVESQYSLQVAAPRLASWFHELARAA